MGAGGQWLWASAMYAESLGFDSFVGIFHNFFLLEYLLCGSRFMLSKFNCNTLGWNTVPSFLFETNGYITIMGDLICN